MDAPAQLRSDTAFMWLRLPGHHALDLLVTSVQGTEGISELFQFRIQVRSTRGDLELQNFVAFPATLELQGSHGTRSIDGMIRRFELIEDGSRLSYYEATLVPPHWFLTQRVQSRIFQKPRYENTSTRAIIAEVFKAAGFEANTVVFSGLHDEQREFTVQYRESDWDFVCRLIEEEGWHFYFDRRENPCTMVIADGQADHSAFAIAPDGDFVSDVPYRDPNGMLAPGEFIHRVRVAREIRQGAVVLDDFSFRDPGGELRAEASKGGFSGLVFSDYPGEYADRQVGQRLAEIRLQERQTGQHSAQMSSSVRAFWPGSTFRLIEHPNSALNREYLITRVWHRGLQTQSAEAEAGGSAGARYESEIGAVPAGEAYRHPRVTRRPTVLGSQTAIVTGPAGEEIYTDAYGRVKVRFHWDQEAEFDENASCWVRVSQGWAGGQYGMMFLPRVGQEVIVDFLEGDPDRPIITGRVYNNDHMPPYKLPDHKTVSSIRTGTSPGAGGCNEIRFEDAKSREQMLLYAQNALHLRSGGSTFESVGWERHETVHKNAYELVKEKKHSTVKLDLIENIEGNREQQVRHDVKSYCGGQTSMFVSGKYRLLNGDGILLASDDGITLQCKGNFIRINNVGITISGSSVWINSGGKPDPIDYLAPGLAEEPKPADGTQHGRNVRYSVKPEEAAGLDDPSRSKGAGSAAEAVETSWIEIELVDEAGQPVAHEPYAVRTPDGQVRRGTLDGDGRARVPVPDPGACDVTFPKLDAAAWEALA